MSMKKVHDRIEADIKRTGRSLIGVFGDETSPEFTYTIGNSAKGLPELLVVGTCEASFLNKLSEMMIERGRKFDHGETVDIGAKCPLYLLDAPDDVKERFTVQATSHFRNADFGFAGYAVMQVVMSDPDGLFPWQDGCAKPYADFPVFRKPNG